MPKPLGHEDEDQDQDQSNQLDPNDDTDTSAQSSQEHDPSVPVVVEEDERLAASDEGEGDDDGEVDPQPSRRRETAKERRERAKRAKEADKQTIEILQRTVAKQNETVEKLRQEFVAKRITDLDERIAHAVAEHDQMDGVYYKAINKNPQDAQQAARLRDEAKQRAWALHTEKEQLIAEAKKPVAQAPVPYVDKARNFLSDKPWYNPKAGDEDSLVVEALDRALSKTMDPNSEGYWETLDRKVRERLPHRFARQQEANDDDAQDDDDRETVRTTQRRKGPPTGGTSRASGSGRGNPSEIRLPKEMVEAMKEAGHWDDPKQRARVAKRYIDGLKNRNG